nr:hypothetical protein [Tissierella sp.]
MKYRKYGKTILGLVFNDSRKAAMKRARKFKKRELYSKGTSKWITCLSGL